MGMSVKIGPRGYRLLTFCNMWGRDRCRQDGIKLLYDILSTDGFFPGQSIVSYQTLRSMYEGTNTRRRYEAKLDSHRQVGRAYLFEEQCPHSENRPCECYL